MKVINLGETNSALNNIIAQVRDRKIQKDSLRFRFKLQAFGEGFQLPFRMLNAGLSGGKRLFGFGNVRFRRSHSVLLSRDLLI